MSIDTVIDELGILVARRERALNEYNKTISVIDREGIYTKVIHKDRNKYLATLEELESKVENKKSEIRSLSNGGK